MAADTVVVAAAAALNTAVVMVSSIVVTIYHRTFRHAGHVPHHADLCHFDDRPIPLVNLSGSA